MMTVLGVLLLVGVAHAAGGYYYSSSYSALCAKVRRMENKINQLQQPIHLHVGGNDQASLSADGTHVHVHMTLDEKPAVTDDGYAYASCYVQPNSAGSSNVRGFVHMRQKPSSKIEIKVNLSGFPVAGQYGFHVHEVANFENGCNTFGGHYNPYDKTHGGPDDTTRHVGDWGNLQVNSNGQVMTTMTDRLASLFGSESIVGRGIVVHAGVDDLGKGGNAGSLSTGNAGPRLACCAIGWTKGGNW